MGKKEVKKERLNKLREKINEGEKEENECGRQGKRREERKCGRERTKGERE